MDKLTPYTARAGRLNQEIEILSQAVQILSLKDDQQTILVLSEKVTQKMAKLTQMLPVLNAALSINEDLLQLDAILQQTTPLSPSQQEISIE